MRMTRLEGSTIVKVYDGKRRIKDLKKETGDDINRDINSAGPIAVVRPQKGVE